VTDVSSTPGGPDAAGTGIDTTVSHSARIWDYWLKGKDNYAVDREVGDRIEEMLPDIVRQAREDRLFLGRVVRYLAGEAGVRQFLDIGTGRYWNEYGTPPGTHRTPDQLARFFDGMDLIEPGVVSITRWRPEDTSSGEPDEIDQFGGVGRKP
jgi:S-adenosyl methyltransferase